MVDAAGNGHNPAANGPRVGGQQRGRWCCVGKEVEARMPVELGAEALTQGLVADPTAGIPPAVDAWIHGMGHHEVADGDDPRTASN